MAPGLSSLVMYVGSTDSAIFNSMATHSPLALQVELIVDMEPGRPQHRRSLLQGVRGAGPEPVPGGRRQRQVDDVGHGFRDLSGRRCLRDIGGRHGSYDQSAAGGAWASETAWVRQRRRHFAGQVCDSLVASDRGGRLLQLLAELSQRARRFSQRQLHLLRVRRPDHLHGQRVRRHQLCRATVGRLPGAGESADGEPTATDARLHQPEPCIRLARDRATTPISTTSPAAATATRPPPATTWPLAGAARTAPRC